MTPSLPSLDVSLGERYRLDEPLGEGGMALVVRGFDLDLDVPRALKLMLPALAKKRSLRERFQAEARIMARLEHPHIVRVFDVGLHGRIPFIVMELLPGGSLHTWIEANGAMPARQAVDVLIDLCDAVQHAHDKGVIHRDIKPHNVLVSSGGDVKLTDFGIARTDHGTTRTGAAMGTLGYVAPEQLANAKSATPAADVYSLAVTLWKLVTDGAVERLAYDLDHGALDDLPTDLRLVLEPALAQRVEQRTQTVATFRDDLLEARERLAVAPVRPLVHDPGPSGDDCPTWDTLAPALREEAVAPTMELSPPAEAPTMQRPPTPRPTVREPEKRGPYVVRLSDDDLEATLKAREARRQRDAEGPSSEAGLVDRLGAEDLDDDSWWWLGSLGRSMGSAARWTVLGLLLAAVPVTLIGGLRAADRYDLFGHRAAVAEARRVVIDTVVVEGPSAVRGYEGEKRTELEQRYLEMEDAEGPEKVEAAERFVEAAEQEIATTLPEDPSQWTPEQRAQVQRLMRMRQAVDAYEEAEEAVEEKAAAE